MMEINNLERLTSFWERRLKFVGGGGKESGKGVQTWMRQDEWTDLKTSVVVWVLGSVIFFVFPLHGPRFNLLAYSFQIS